MLKEPLKVSKHRTKKDNKHKLRVIKNTQAIMSEYTITLVMANGENQCSAIYSHGKRVKVSPQLAWHFDNTRCKWDVLCGVINRDQQGKHYIEYVSFGSTHECLLDDLSQLAYDCCKQMFDRANKLHKLCPFYMARAQKSIDPILILDNIKTHKVLNLIGTNFEFNVNKGFKDYHTTEEWINVLDTIQFKELDLEFADETEDDL